MLAEEGLAPHRHATPPPVPPPPGACDCHAHVFGPFDRFPLATDRHYTPAELPGARYLAMLDEIGFARGVVVQGGAHGTDCGAMLDALRRAPNRLRGIALITPDSSDQRLAEMNDAGVRGARFSRLPFGLTHGAVPFEALCALAPRLARLGWHAQVQSSCDHLLSIMPALLATGLPIVIDHMGLVDIDKGTDDGAFRRLAGVLREEQVWLKLSAYRLSHDFPDYRDVRPFHEILLAGPSERLLWGSDWPHVHMTGDMPDDGHLVDLFQQWTPDEAVRQRILVDNPARLYGF